MAIIVAEDRWTAGSHHQQLEIDFSMCFSSFLTVYNVTIKFCMLAMSFGSMVHDGGTPLEAYSGL